jgi:hypothetical protein
MAEQTKTARETRELDTREKHARPTRWMPAQLLPEPYPEEGYAFRWIRLSTMGMADATNVSSKLREGWEPVKASQHPEIQLMGESTRFPDSIEVGGLLLCKTPVEFTVQRDEYYQQVADTQMQSVDNNYMRESDPRMPMFKERSSKVTIGKSI